MPNWSGSVTEPIPATGHPREKPPLNQLNKKLISFKKQDLSGSFSLGWPVAGMGPVTDPDQFGMFGTLDPNILHAPKGFGFEAITTKLRPFL